MALPNVPREALIAFIHVHFVSRQNVPALADFILLSEAAQEQMIKDWASQSSAALQGQKIAAEAVVTNIDAQIAALDAIK